MSTTDGRCGRPTKAKTSCRSTLRRGQVACDVHATDEDRQYAKAFNEGHQKGFSSGWEAGQEHGAAQVRAELERAAKAAAAAANFRLQDHAGRQIVTVDSRYAYVWTGKDPLKVDDIVELPGTSFLPDWEGRVTSLGSSYTGQLSRVRGLVERAS